MASDYRRADVIEYAPGRFVEVGSKGTDVLVWEPGANVLLRFDGEARDKFMRAYVLAEMDAEKAEAAQGVIRRCARCRHVLVDQDDAGWYFQVPVTDPRMPGMTFMDRVHECEGKPHDVRLEKRPAEAAQATGTEGQ